MLTATPPACPERERHGADGEQSERLPTSGHGRVSASLENRYTRKAIVGSNPPACDESCDAGSVRHRYVSTPGTISAVRPRSERHQSAATATTGINCKTAPRPPIRGHHLLVIHCHPCRSGSTRSIWSRWWSSWPFSSARPSPLDGRSESASRSRERSGRRSRAAAGARPGCRTAPRVTCAIRVPPVASVPDDSRSGLNAGEFAATRARTDRTNVATLENSRGDTCHVSAELAGRLATCELTPD